MLQLFFKQLLVKNVCIRLPVCTTWQGAGQVFALFGLHNLLSSTWYRIMAGCIRRCCFAPSAALPACLQHTGRQPDCTCTSNSGSKHHSMVYHMYMPGNLVALDCWQLLDSTSVTSTAHAQTSIIHCRMLQLVMRLHVQAVSTECASRTQLNWKCTVCHMQQLCKQCQTVLSVVPSARCSTVSILMQETSSDQQFHRGLLCCDGSVRSPAKQSARLECLAINEMQSREGSLAVPQPFSLCSEFPDIVGDTGVAGQSG